MTGYIGIGKETLTRRKRLRFRLRTLVMWAQGRSSFDGRVRYIHSTPDTDT